MYYDTDGSPVDAYISRAVAMNAGLPKETPAFNVNRLCGSGLQAIVALLPLKV